MTLTDDEIREMRNEYQTTDKSQPDLADEYGVSASAVNQIVNFKVREDVGGLGRGQANTDNRKKLSHHTVNQIRVALDQGQSTGDVAGEHGVTDGTIRAIKSGRTWGEA